MYRAGVCSILSQLAREGRLVVVDTFTVDSPKTKLLAQKVKSMGFENVLIVTDSVDENLLLSCRNLPNVNVCAVSHADPVSLIRHANVLLTKNAMAKFEELLK
jgi:large subunit ribosomal protein L4